MDNPITTDDIYSKIQKLTAITHYKNKTIVVDLATIHPGKGGAGGGIWTYAYNLINQIDNILSDNCSEITFLCLVNRNTNLKLKNIETFEVPINTSKFLQRLTYVHVWLPIFVWRKKALLHKVYFEVPFFAPFPLMVTI